MENILCLKAAYMIHYMLVLWPRCSIIHLNFKNKCVTNCEEIREKEKQQTQEKQRGVQESPERSCFLCLEKKGDWRAL